MKTHSFRTSHTRAFTLLEVVIVLAITALVLGAVYSLAQGTLTLADDVSRAQRRDTRTQAFTTFCERLFGELPAPATLNLVTTQENGQYLTRLELRHVRSPFDDTPDNNVTLFTERLPGGGLRMLLTCQSNSAAQAVTRAVLFEELRQCEWRVYDSTQQWATLWTENIHFTAPMPQRHPPLVKLIMEEPGAAPSDHLFWIAPAEWTNANQPP